MKGIVLAGGTGSRLWPITKSVNKHLLAIYDKPMVFYPISCLMLAGIVDILLISRPQDLPLFLQLLGDGSAWGIKISYACQDQPNGIAQAFLIAEEFIGEDDVALALGDNIFYGNGFVDKLKAAKENLKQGYSSIFAYSVDDPERFGVVNYDQHGDVLGIEEKPNEPKSNYAVTGLYFYTNDVVDFAKQLSPSERGELEITDINKKYLQLKKLRAISLGRGFAWLDTGTFESLLEASSFIATLEKRQGFKVLAPEEIAFRMGYISKEQLSELILGYGNSPYANYLKRLMRENNET